MPGGEDKNSPLENNVKIFKNIIEDFQKIENDDSITEAKFNRSIDKLRGSVLNMKMNTLVTASYCYYFHGKKRYKNKYRSLDDFIKNENIGLSRSFFIDLSNMFEFILDNIKYIKSDTIIKLGYRNFKTLAEKTKKLPLQVRVNYLKKLEFKYDDELREELNKLIKSNSKT
ncbi:MAG: hypothetical protein OEZ13_10100 [Spirochaetia bacterium]|nr:hypothetical protein [Spirochaetia bacterium]